MMSDSIRADFGDIHHKIVELQREITAATAARDFTRVVTLGLAAREAELQLQMANARTELESQLVTFQASVDAKVAALDQRQDAKLAAVTDRVEPMASKIDMLTHVVVQFAAVAQGSVQTPVLHSPPAAGPTTLKSPQPAPKVQGNPSRTEQVHCSGSSCGFVPVVAVPASPPPMGYGNQKPKDVRTWHVVASEMGSKKQAVLDLGFNPHTISVAPSGAVFMLDRGGRRVVRIAAPFKAGLIEGTKADFSVVVGPLAFGKGLDQIGDPFDAFPLETDTLTSVFVADYRNRRIVRWDTGAQEGKAIATNFPAAKIAGNQERLFGYHLNDGTVWHWPLGPTSSEERKRFLSAARAPALSALVVIPPAATTDQPSLLLGHESGLTLVLGATRSLAEPILAPIPVIASNHVRAVAVSSAETGHIAAIAHGTVHVWRGALARFLSPHDRPPPPLELHEGERLVGPVRPCALSFASDGCLLVTDGSSTNLHAFVL